MVDLFDKQTSLVRAGSSVQFTPAAPPNPSETASFRNSPESANCGTAREHATPFRGKLGDSASAGCESGKPYSEIDDPKVRKSVLTRLGKYALIDNGCWEWTGYKNHHGYGRMMIWQDGKKRLLAAHKLAYEIFRGPVPEGFVVMHTCDNPSCVNPSHLRLGTQRENIWDCVRKGRNQ